MPNICLGNLFPSSVLAYDGIDLIPNGFIPEVGTTARPRIRVQNGQRISERETVRLLPADRIYAEFWFGVSSRVTGTNKGDAGSGAFAALGFLGGGAGAVIGGAIACELTGDSEKTFARWVFHVADAETRINREYTLTAIDIQTKTITLPDYVIGILGVTRNPIVFVTPDIPLTPEQIAEAKAKPADEVESKLGRRVAPSQLTDSDMRVLLGISDLNELENLGNSHRNIRGWPQTAEGQIQGEFTNFKYSDKENLFTNIVRDVRKNHYRADNEYEKTQGHCFWNGSTDDLTDKKIAFRLLEDESATGSNSSTPVTPLKAGDKVYISYSASTNPIFRHATENVTNFFLFPDQSAYQLPPLDLIKGWNFKKFKFKVRKNAEERATLADFVNDADIQKQIEQLQQDTSLTGTDKQKQIDRLQNKILLEDMECQRIIESKLEKANRNPVIKGCYFIDSRGILSVDFRGGGEPQLLVSASSIRDQQWFTDLLTELRGSTAYDENGILDLGKANSSLFDDFLFDVSDHVNTSTYDNEKFGYERRFAKAISKCSIFDANNPLSGIGSPNLDLIKNQTPGRNIYDLTSAKFDSVPMQGSGFLFSCNVTFVYDLGFCNKGTISADMLLRTPTFLAKLTKKTRIYVEKFSAQFPLRRDGAIWVGTTPSLGENYSVTTNPKNDLAYLVYPDTSNGTTSYRVFEDGVFNTETHSLKQSDPHDGHVLPSVDSSLTEAVIRDGGYDKILGDQPGYFRGKEITTENALIAIAKSSSTSIITERLVFTKEDSGRINIVGIPNRRIRKITIGYYPLSKDFLDIERSIAFIFPNSKTIIDNIGIPYQGLFAQHERKLCVETKYVIAENWFIDGEILQSMKINYIDAEMLEETEYQKYKITSSVVSTCFDSAGNWLIFYEDDKGGEGETTVDGRSADGSHITGPVNIDERPGLEDKSETEISCLISSDYGYTWFCHKGIVRTVAGEQVRSPYCIIDKQTNEIHLFYVLNDTLMHKSIDSAMFQYEDAFLAYKRPNKLDENTIPEYGLFHFSSGGIQLRESPGSVVIGNLSGDYLKAQLEITNKMRAKTRDDFRIFVSGDESNYTEGFPEVDFIAYKDSVGRIKVMFVSNGKFFCRESPNNGRAWFDVIPGGMLIHKNSNIQELKSIEALGVVVDLKKHFSYLTYQVDGMLFVRRFEAISSIDTDSQLKDVFDANSELSQPVFVVGVLDSETKTAIKNKETPVIFPYKDVDVFGSAFSISETPSLGYATSDGTLRFFYKDSAGNFRAFSYSDTPKLDIDYSKGD